MPVAEVARQMLDYYPRELNVDRGLFVQCIEACYDCAESCTQCADDCLAEESVQELTTCIRLNLDCRTSVSQRDGWWAARQALTQT